MTPRVERAVRRGWRRRPLRLQLFSILTLVLLAWGALAFGAEYSWAYAPLLVLSVTAALLGLSTSQGARIPFRSLAMALGGVFAVGLIQLVPLPRRVVSSVSPAAEAVPYDRLYATATMQPEVVPATAAAATPRPLSIAPSRTVLGLVFLAALALFLFGCVHGISIVGPRGIAAGVLALGVLVGLLAIVQRASGSQLVYGLWHSPQFEGLHSAPFVNRNHTAGWLLMAVSLSTGYFAGAVASRAGSVKPDWRHRILWLSSQDASEILIAGFAIGVMAIAIVATASRSGSACLALAIPVFGWWAARALPSGRRKWIVLAALLAIVFAAVSVGGGEILAGRLRRTSWSNLDGRLVIWQDALAMIRDFPVSGTGLNTFGIAMLHYQTVNDGYLYIEAHNDYLQLVAEGGVLLGVPLSIALVLLVREIVHRFREAADDASTYWLRAGAVTGLCAVAIQELADFTLQMPGAAALFVVLAAIAIHRPLHVRREPLTPHVEETAMRHTLLAMPGAR